MNQNRSFKEQGWDRMQEILQEQMPEKPRDRSRNKRVFFVFSMVLLFTFFIYGLLSKGIFQDLHNYFRPQSGVNSMSDLLFLNTRETSVSQETFGLANDYFSDNNEDLPIKIGPVPVLKDSRDENLYPADIKVNLIEKINGVEKAVLDQIEIEPLPLDLNGPEMSRIGSEGLELLKIPLGRVSSLQQETKDSFSIPTALFDSFSAFSNKNALPLIKSTPRFSFFFGNDWVFDAQFSIQPNFRFSFEWNGNNPLLTTFVGLGFSQLTLQRDYIYREMLVAPLPGGEEPFVVSELAYLRSLNEWSTEIGVRYKILSSLYLGLSLQPSLWQFRGNHLDKIKRFRKSDSSYSAIAWVLNVHPVVGYAFSERLGIQCSYTFNLNQFDAENLFKESQGLKVNRLGLGLFYLF
jgi:hypothetical protein